MVFDICTASSVPARNWHTWSSYDLWEIVISLSTVLQNFLNFEHLFCFLIPFFPPVQSHLRLSSYVRRRICFANHILYKNPKFSFGNLTRWYFLFPSHLITSFIYYVFYQGLMEYFHKWRKNELVDPTKLNFVK